MKMKTEKQLLLKMQNSIVYVEITKIKNSSWCHKVVDCAVHIIL